MSSVQAEDSDNYECVPVRCGVCHVDLMYSIDLNVITERAINSTYE